MKPCVPFRENLLFLVLIVCSITVSFRVCAESKFCGINPDAFYDRQRRILSSANDILTKIQRDSTSACENKVFVYHGTKKPSTFGNISIKKSEDAYLLKFLGDIADISLNMGDHRSHFILSTNTVCLEKLSEFYNSMPAENLFPYWLIFVVNNSFQHQFSNDNYLWLNALVSQHKLNPDYEYEDFIEENPESIFSKNYQIMLTTYELSRMIKGILKSLQSSSKESIINQLINK